MGRWGFKHIFARDPTPRRLTGREMFRRSRSVSRHARRHAVLATATGAGRAALALQAGVGAPAVVRASRSAAPLLVQAELAVGTGVVLVARALRSRDAGGEAVRACGAARGRAAVTDRPRTAVVTEPSTVGDALPDAKEAEGVDRTVVVRRAARRPARARRGRARAGARGGAAAAAAAACARIDDRRASASHDLEEHDDESVAPKGHGRANRIASRVRAVTSVRPKTRGFGQAPLHEKR